MSTQPPHWFVITGAKAGKDQTSGPYRMEELREQLRAGRLTPETRVTAPHLGDQTLSLRDAMALPPRPAEIEASALPTANLEPASDPALSLFDSLQEARDRKAHQKQLADAAVTGLPRPSRTPVWLGLVLGGALFLGALVWWLNPKPDPTPPASQRLAQPASASVAAPAARGAPAPAPASAAVTPARPAQPLPPITRPANIHIEEMRPDERLEEQDERDRDQARERDRDHEREGEHGLVAEPESAPTNEPESSDGASR